MGHPKSVDPDSNLQNLAAHEGLDEEPGVEGSDDDGGSPGEALEPAAVYE